MRRSHSNDAGFVLISVLWLIAALALVATVALRATDTLQKGQSYRERARELQSHADGIARIVALHELISPQGISRPRLARCRRGALTIEIESVRPTGLIDINAAPFELIEIGLRLAGLDPPEAAALAEAIVEYRGPEKLGQSAEVARTRYRELRRPFGPKFAPFDTTGELDQIPGLEPRVLPALLGLVTVHSGIAIVAGDAAPEKLRKAIEDSRLRSFLRTGVTPGDIIEVRIAVVRDDGLRRSRRGVAEIDRRHGQGVRWREWSPAGLPPMSDSSHDEGFCRTMGLAD